MTLKSNIFAASIAAVGLTPFAAFADQINTADFDQLQQATVTTQAAADIALAAHAGRVAAIQINDENGAGIYEAVVLGADGKAWMVKVDAKNGAVVADGKATLIGDHEDGEDTEQADDNNGTDQETNDD